jgi:DNA repair protein RecN (Recombination protein N)
MLRELSVQNLALIEDVRVELQPGFCAWTGETGAGKSLLLGALGLLLGERGSADLIRTGAEELRVTGVFELAFPEMRAAVEKALEEPLAEDQVILARRLSRAGRSSAYVNDRPVTLTTLKQIGAVFVDIHGQRENQSLLEAGYQLQLLDAFGNLQTPRQKYHQLADQVRELRRRRTALLTDRERRQRDLQLLRFEREELDAADLKAGELESLAQERERLVHAQSLQEFAAGGCDLLYDAEGSVVEQVGRLVRDAEDYQRYDPALAEVVLQLQSLNSQVRDVAETLRDLAQKYEADPGRLEEVEQRLQLLRKLQTKYAKTVDELIPYRAALDEQEKTLQRQEDDLAGIDGELAKVYAQLRDAAAELSKQRKKVAKKFVSEVQKHLADLGMPDARLEASLEPLPLPEDPAAADLPAHGAEQLELMLAANKGEPARPLRKVASGGEMARTMLALKTVLAAHDKVGTLVFDEIDANVGGRLGDVLGEKLAILGRTHQVISVTHLPQVASYARHQWTIRKGRRGERTATTIALLNGEPDRVEELASMLRGESRGETTRKEAAAMLAKARKSW